MVLELSAVAVFYFERILRFQSWVIALLRMYTEEWSSLLGSRHQVLVHPEMDLASSRLEQ
jgi:hypothetical protein